MKTVPGQALPSRTGPKPLLAGIALLLTLCPLLAAHAHTPAGDDEQQLVSAHEAKRLARDYLCKAGYCNRFGPGAAKIRSTTLDDHTWVLTVSLSEGGLTFNQRHMLYISATSGLVSEIPQAEAPTRAAAE